MWARLFRYFMLFSKFSLTSLSNAKTSKEKQKVILQQADTTRDYGVLYEPLISDEKGTLFILLDVSK